MALPTGLVLAIPARLRSKCFAFLAKKTSVFQDIFIKMSPKEKDGSPVIDDIVDRLRIMVIPNTPLASEIVIADDLFEGMISPTRGRNLVVD